MDNCVNVSKQHGRVYGDGDDKSSWKVVAYDASPEGSYQLAKGLTEKQADTLLNTLWRAIPSEDSFDVQGWVK